MPFRIDDITNLAIYLCPERYTRNPTSKYCEPKNCETFSDANGIGVCTDCADDYFPTLDALELVKHLGRDCVLPLECEEELKGLMVRNGSISFCLKGATGADIYIYIYIYI